MVFDSDVLIWYLRGNQNAVDLVKKYAPFKITSISYMELVQGMKNKKELSDLKKVIKALKIEILHPTIEISQNAMSLVENFFLSNSMEMPDALIGSICIKNEETLCTANDKHYKVIPNLKLEIFRP